MVHACIISVQSQLILLSCYSLKCTVCWNNVVIVRCCFLAGSIWRWQKLYSAVWKWLLSPVCMCLLPELFYWQSFIEVCIYVTQVWLVAVLLIWFQTQVLIAHIFCATLKSSVLSATFTALPVHYEYKRMYFLNILLIFSHESIVQVCLSLFLSRLWADTLLHDVRTLYHMSMKLNCLRLFVVHTFLAQIILSS